MYQSPNFQGCQKAGMRHWNRDEPYPYGYEEFVVKRKRCLIDLEMFKLVNSFFFFFFNFKFDKQKIYIKAPFIYFK